LVTWGQVLSGEELRKQIAPILERVTDFHAAIYPQRQTATQAITYHLAIGDLDGAMTALEIAICSLEPPEKVEEWKREQFSQAPGLGFHQCRLLFPAMEANEIAARYYKKAFDQILEWDRAGRLSKRSLFEVVCFLTGRLHQVGSVGARDIGLTTARELKGNNHTYQLWFADLLRLCGQEDEPAQIERELLRSSRLVLGRIPEVLKRIAETEGTATALQLGLPLTEWCGHPTLLKSLETLLLEAGRTEEAERLKTWQAEDKELATAVRKQMAEARRLR
jgi:hypothetical protein